MSVDSIINGLNYVFLGGGSCFTGIGSCGDCREALKNKQAIKALGDTPEAEKIRMYADDSVKMASSRLGAGVVDLAASGSTILDTAKEYPLVAPIAASVSCIFSGMGLCFAYKQRSDADRELVELEIPVNGYEDLLKGLPKDEHAELIKAQKELAQAKINALKVTMTKDGIIIATYVVSNFVPGLGAPKWIKEYAVPTACAVMSFARAGYMYYMNKKFDKTVEKESEFYDSTNSACEREKQHRNFLKIVVNPELADPLLVKPGSYNYIASPSDSGYETDYRIQSVLSEKTVVKTKKSKTGKQTISIQETVYEVESQSKLDKAPGVVKTESVLKTKWKLEKQELTVSAESINV